MRSKLLKAVAMALAMLLLLPMLAACDLTDKSLAGPQGPAGADGQNGQDGKDGKDGKSAYELAVENGYEGTLEEWLESLVGDTGAVGMNGKSAYELAVENGYDGTLEEWLKSLVGKQGSAGQNGTNGTNGKDITNAYVDEYYHLWLELSDGSKCDTGYVGPLYTVMFKDTDGSVIHVASNLHYGKSVTYNESPVKKGYNFVGWFDSPEGGNEFDLSSPITENMEVFAHWEKAKMELSCTQSELFVNEETTVYFYARVSTEISSVVLCDVSTNAVLAEMLDNGKYSENGDDLQGDSVFSCKLTVHKTEAGVCSYYALADTEEASNQIQISVVAPLTEEESEHIESVGNVLTEALSESQNLTEQEKATALQNALSSLSNPDNNDGVAYVNDETIYYDATNGIVSFEYETGVVGLVALKDIAASGSNIAGGAATTYATGSLPVTLYAENFTPTDTINKTVGDATIMYSFDDPADSDWLQYYELCGDAWTASGLITEIYTNPTVEDYKTAFLGSEFVVIAEHGYYMTLYNDNTTSIIVTTEETSFWKNLAYAKDLISGRVVTLTLADGSTVYCLTSEFFEFYYGNERLDGSIVYMDNCNGFGQGSDLNYDFANAFMVDAGVETVYGYHESVYIQYGIVMMDSIVYDLLNGETTGVSGDNAIALYGEKDTDYARQYWPGWTEKFENGKLLADATFIMAGSEDAVLVNSDFLNGSFELELEGWNTVGDVRIINKLAEFMPVHGDNMAILTTGIGSTESDYLQGTEGSILLQSFVVPQNASEITLSYNVISEEPMEYVNSEYDDKFIIEILDSAGSVISQLGYETVNTSIWNSVSGINFEGGDNTTYCTQWKNGSYNGLSDYVGEEVTLRVRIWDVGDSVYDTAVLIDNIVLQ